MIFTEHAQVHEGDWIETSDANKGDFLHLENVPLGAMLLRGEQGYPTSLTYPQ